MCELSPVSFHGDTIFCVEFDGQPYAPMRPIVENIGMEWGAQAAKFRANKERWGVSIIDTPSNGGNQPTLCLPVRKLPAWLASINPKKVRPELRAKIELYQNECDDALWDYWIKGRAERQSPDGLPPSDQNVIQTLVKNIADRYPQTEQKGIYMQVWMRFRNHFRIGSYKQLPPERMAEAVTYLANFEVREKKTQAALPKSYEPLSVTGAESLANIMDLRRKIVKTSMDIMYIMQHATHHGDVAAIPEEHKKLARELDSSITTFFMCINNNLIGVEHMFKAFCEAEKLIYG